MKIRVILGIIAIVGFTSLLLYNFGNSISTYVSFEEAENMSSAHVVGKLDKDKPYGFSREHKQLRFFMEDQQGNTRRVVYPKSMPNNFEQADQLVVIGELKNDVFYADEMLMKCPSKYNDAKSKNFQASKSQS